MLPKRRMVSLCAGAGLGYGAVMGGVYAALCVVVGNLVLSDPAGRTPAPWIIGMAGFAGLVGVILGLLGGLVFGFAGAFRRGPAGWCAAGIMGGGAPGLAVTLAL